MCNLHTNEHLDFHIGPMDYPAAAQPKNGKSFKEVMWLLIFLQNYSYLVVKFATPGLLQQCTQPMSLCKFNKSVRLRWLGSSAHAHKMAIGAEHSQWRFHCVAAISIFYSCSTSAAP